MTDVKFGMMYAAMEEFVGPVEMGEKAEAWGYDSFWMPDFALEPCMDPLVSLAAVAQKTSRIRLGTAVLLLPYKHPIMLAKAVASVDVLSGGRFIFGIGIGGRAPEFDALGLDIRQRGRVSDERLHVLKRLFTESTVTHQGRYDQFEDVTSGPRPVQRPHPPIWVGPMWEDGFAEGALRRTARYGDGFVPARVTVDGYREGQERVRAYAEEYGRDPHAIEWGLLLWLCLDENREEAQALFSKELVRRMHQADEIRFDRGYALGAAEDCIEVIENYMSVGVTHFVLDAGTQPSEMAQQYERFAKEVMPHFRGLVG